MKCNNCGYENPEGTNFCSYCGNKIESLNETGESANFDNVNIGPSFNQKLTNLLKSPMFLAFCICISASTLIGIFSLSFDVIRILIVIFSWLVYAAAYKNKLDTVNLRRISGTYFAHYVLNYVVAGALALVGFLYLALGYAAVDIYKYINDYSSSIAGLLGVRSSLVGIVFIVVAAIVIIINIIGTKKIHGFLQSVYKSGEINADNLRNLNISSIWILIIGILSAIGTFINLSLASFLASGSLTAAYILLFIMMNKFKK